MIRRALVTLAVSALLGCATVAPKPSDPQRSGLALSMTIRAPIAIFTRSPERIYFIRVEGGSDPYLQRTVLVSNYVRGGYVYLLDVPPGRYAAVAAWFPSAGPNQKADFITVFPRAVIAMTDTTVAAGTVRFMGEYVLDTKVGLGHADDAQRYYLSLAEPGGARPIMTVAQFYYAGTLNEGKRDPDGERRFLGTALEHLDSGGWSAAVRRSLEQGAGR